MKTISSIRRHLSTAAVAASVAAVVAAAPTLAATVSSALNADKVDGIHATRYTTNTVTRKGKLVATNSRGKLPNNIINTAPNSSRLGGLRSSAFLRSTATAADSSLLDGLDSTSFLRSTATAADSTLLDGLDSTAFVQGTVSTDETAGWPSAKVYDSAADISIADATPTVVTFDSESFDTASLHSTTSNAGRLTAPVTGIYTVAALTHWGGTSNDERISSIRRNGTEVLGKVRTVQDDANEQFQSLTAIVKLEAGDYVELVVEQNAGLGGTPLVLDSDGTSLAMAWSGPAS